MMHKEERAMKRFWSARRIRAALQTLLATLVMLAMVFPLYWMIITSFKTTEEGHAHPRQSWPSQRR